MNNTIGSEKLNNMLTKVVNPIINGYIKRTSTIDHDFDFKIKVRKSTKIPFVGCGAGSSGEPYSYVVEVYSDITVPKYFTYNDEYREKYNKIASGYHNSVLTGEIKNLLKMTGMDIDSFGNVFGVCFMNVE